MPDCLRMSVKRMAAGGASFFADCCASGAREICGAKRSASAVNDELRKRRRGKLIRTLEVGERRKKKLHREHGVRSTEGTENFELTGTVRSFAGVWWGRREEKRLRRSARRCGAVGRFAAARAG